MRPASCLILLALVAACAADSSPGPTILPPQQPIPFQPPSITKVVPVAGTVGSLSAPSTTFTVSGFFLNLKLDASDVPSIVLTRTHDLQGNPTTGPKVQATAQSEGVQAGTGSGAVDFHFHPPTTGVYTVTLTTAAGTATAPDAIAALPAFSIVPPAQRVYCAARTSTVDVQAVAPITTLNVINAGLPPALPTWSDARGNPDVGGAPWTVTADQCDPVWNFPFVSTCSGLHLHLPDGFTDQRARLSVQNVFDDSQSFDVLFEGAGAQDRRELYAIAGPSVPISFGGSFVVDGAAGPRVTLDGAPIDAAISGCFDSGFPGKQFCDGLSVQLSPDTAPGSHTLVATGIAGCSSTTTVVVHAPPVIQSVAPVLQCEKAVRDIVITGSEFLSPDVFVDGQLVPASTGNIICPSTTCLTISAAGLTVGTHQVQVRSHLAGVSLDSPPAGFTIALGPPIPQGFASPSTVLAGAARPFFVQVANKTGAVISGGLVQADGSIKPAQVVDVPGGALITAPADAEPGDYRTVVGDESPCGPSAGPIVTLAASPVVAQFGFDASAENFVFGSVSPSGTFFIDVFDRTTWKATGGNPGGEVTGPIGFNVVEEKVFEAVLGSHGNDLAVLRFDLSSCAVDGVQTPAVRAQVSLFGSFVDANRGFVLTRPIDPPGCAFTHYDVPLDASWTFTDDQGSRPATVSDFAQDIGSIRIPANFTPNANDLTIVGLDNVVLELSQ